jgi:chromosome segregation ATPase
VAGDGVAALVSHATELERRDEELARELAGLAEIGERAGVARAQAADVRSALARLPAAVEELAGRTERARDEVGLAEERLRAAEERLAGLERSRRRKQEELDRATRDAATARAAAADAQGDLERLTAAARELRASEPRLRAEAATLTRTAAGIATELAGMPRVANAAGLEPGESLAELEEWGLLVRSALLVARGTLESEREQIVVEANALAAGALGEPLGASSVALVRRRLEQLT